jgi:predicted SPOUT superfamily RNA methylase MTH1
VSTHAYATHLPALPTPDTPSPCVSVRDDIRAAKPIIHGVVWWWWCAAAAPGEGSYVHVGLGKDVVLDRRIQPNVRVTVKLDPSTRHQRVIRGSAVSNREPREKHGTYWGYSVRMASGLQSLLDECPFEGGYDLTIGTSERCARHFAAASPPPPPPPVLALSCTGDVFWLRFSYVTPVLS